MIQNRRCSCPSQLERLDPCHDRSALIIPAVAADSQTGHPKAGNGQQACSSHAGSGELESQLVLLVSTQPILPGS